MQLATIKCDRWKAREKMAEYLRAVRERHNTEDATILAGYRALSRGCQLIDLHETLRQGGVNSVNHPKLAICRADSQWCWFDASRSVRGRATYSIDRFAYDGHTRKFVAVPRTLFGPNYELHQTIHALVPSIPPSLRPKGSLDKYHILWEARWEAIAPRDPALLRHIAGPLYAVLATWDLTELERAVLGLRLQERN